MYVSGVYAMEGTVHWMVTWEPKMLIALKQHGATGSIGPGERFHVTAQVKDAIVHVFSICT